MTPRRLENEEEEEFLEVWVRDLTLFSRFGRFGSKGTLNREKFWTRAAARAELEALLEEKLDEGFVEVVPQVEKPVEEPNVYLFFFVCVFFLFLFMLLPSHSRPPPGVRPNRANYTPEPPRYWGSPSP